MISRYNCVILCIYVHKYGSLKNVSLKSPTDRMTDPNADLLPLIFCSH